MRIHTKNTLRQNEDVDLNCSFSFKNTTISTALALRCHKDKKLKCTVRHIHTRHFLTYRGCIEMRMQTLNTHQQNKNAYLNCSFEFKE